MPQLGNWTGYLDMCPDQELNLQSFGVQTTLQPTELSGQGWMMNFLMALLLGTHWVHLVQRIGCTWPWPFFGVTTVLSLFGHWKRGPERDKLTILIKDRALYKTAKFRHVLVLLCTAFPMTQVAFLLLKICKHVITMWPQNCDIVLSPIHCTLNIYRSYSQSYHNKMERGGHSFKKNKICK